MSALWPDSLQEAAFANLRNTLLDLRRALGAEGARLRAPTPHLLSLDLEGAYADVLHFDSAVVRQEASSLDEAVALYRGPLLEGCAEPWAFEERQMREQACLSALETLAGRAASGGDHTAAERLLRRAVAIDPLRETAHRALMEALAAAGNVAAAQRVYTDLCLLLQTELETEPHPATTALFRSLRDPGRAPSDDDRLPTGRASARAPKTARLALSAPCRSARRSFRPISRSLEPVGGAVPPGSPFYVVRAADALFGEAVARHDSIVLVKGARQTGKTSLLARGLQQSRQLGHRVVLTDLQMLNAEQLATPGQFLLALAHALVAELDLDLSPAEAWKSGAGPNLTFDLFLRRQVLGVLDGHVVWALDGVDRLFGHDYATEVFGLFRSWHDRRYLSPFGAWSRLTLVMAYATEAHLFVTDLNQSPFNVGTRLELEDFSRSQVMELNLRHGCPLRDDAEIERFYRLVSGHPYLVRRGLYEMSQHSIELSLLETQAEQDHGPFGDHLRRLHALLVKSPDLLDAVRSLLRGSPCPTAESFYRLRTAGVVTGDAAADARLRCRLYTAYLQRHLL
jgi:DNA-binding SARP family transcriptional activator